jgi:hypothetical protein
MSRPKRCPDHKRNRSSTWGVCQRCKTLAFGVENLPSPLLRLSDKYSALMAGQLEKMLFSDCSVRLRMVGLLEAVK